jgi:hypothetical protein
LFEKLGYHLEDRDWVSILCRGRDFTLYLIVEKTSFQMDQMGIFSRIKIAGKWK